MFSIFSCCSGVPAIITADDIHINAHLLGRGLTDSQDLERILRAVAALSPETRAYICNQAERLIAESMSVDERLEMIALYTPRSLAILSNAVPISARPLSEPSTARSEPAIHLENERLAEVLQAEIAFTVKTAAKTILATYGCGPCVAVGGYSEDLTFLAHFATPEQVRGAESLIFNQIATFSKGKKAKIQLHLRGGTPESQTVEAIKMLIKKRPSHLPRMEIASQEPSEDSLAIDSRDGKLTGYNPLTNPDRREPDPMRTLMAQQVLLITVP